MQKKILLISVSLLLFTGQLKAYDFIVDRMSFNVLSINNLTASLESIDKSITGDFIVPSTIEYSGKTLTITTIGSSCFVARTLTSITIPNTISTIYEAAFGDLIVESLVIQDGLEPLTFGGGGTELYVRQFDDGHVTNVYIGRTIDYTNKYSSSLFGTSYLKTVSIGKNVKKICKRAFSGASSLKSIIIPDNIENIGEFVFSGCSLLNNIYLSRNINSIGISAFQDCIGLDSLNIPDGVSIVESSIFQGCSKLKKILIPNNTVQIGQYAFSNCISLTDIVIPESVLNIGKMAFKGCENLKSITMLGATPFPITEDVFSVSSYWNGKLFVPNSSIQVFKSTIPWNNFQNIQALTTTAITRNLIYNNAIYTSPTSDFINVLLDKNSEPLNLIVYNTNGIKVKEYLLTESRLKFDVSNFKTGLYFVEVCDLSGKIQKIGSFLKH